MNIYNYGPWIRMHFGGQIINIKERELDEYLSPMDLGLVCNLTIEFFENGEVKRKPPYPSRYRIENDSLGTYISSYMRHGDFTWNRIENKSKSVVKFINTIPDGLNTCK